MYNNRNRLGLLGLAVALASGMVERAGYTQAESAMFGHSMLFQLANKYRENGRYIRRNSGVPAARRAKAKRRNIAKHPRSLHGRKRRA